MQKRKRGRQSQLFCHSHPHRIDATCHLTAMEGRGKGREELGVEEAFAFVLTFRVRVDGQVVLPHPAGRSTNKLFPIVSQRQTNDCGALSVSRPLSLSPTSLQTEGDSNNGVGTGGAGNGSQRLSSASPPPLPITKMTCGPSHGGPTTAVGLSFTGRSSHSSGIFQNLSI